MNIAPEEERFSKNTTIMAQAIHECVTKLYNAGYKNVDPGIVAIAVTIISAFDRHYLIQGFIENSHENCWDNIKARKEEFFVDNASEVFRYLPMDKVNLFKDLFQTKDSRGNSVVPNSLKDQLWDLFDAMVKICIKYIHKNRSPYSYRSDDKLIKAYNASFFDEVNITRHSEIWDVTLDFPLQC